MDITDVFNIQSESREVFDFENSSQILGLQDLVHYNEDSCVISDRFKKKTSNLLNISKPEKKNSEYPKFDSPKPGLSTEMS